MVTLINMSRAIINITNNINLPTEILSHQQFVMTKLQTIHWLKADSSSAPLLSNTDFLLVFCQSYLSLIDRNFGGIL